MTTDNQKRREAIIKMVDAWYAPENKKRIQDIETATQQSTSMDFPTELKKRIIATFLESSLSSETAAALATAFPFFLDLLEVLADPEFCAQWQYIKQAMEQKMEEGLDV